jgi:hypothetical protein
MKNVLIASVLSAVMIATPAIAADVGVSVSIGQPGFYGRIDIGDYPYPQPRVIYSQPRVVERVYVEREPIYMRVPPGHARNWRKYCYKYNACGERVYFVQDSWYNQEYAPRYREQHSEHRDERWEDHHDRGKGHHDNHGNNHHGNHRKNH